MTGPQLTPYDEIAFPTIKNGSKPHNPSSPAVASAKLKQLNHRAGGPTPMLTVSFVSDERDLAPSGSVSPRGSCARQMSIRVSLGTLVLWRMPPIHSMRQSRSSSGKQKINAAGDSAEKRAEGEEADGEGENARVPKRSARWRWRGRLCCESWCRARRQAVE